MNVVVCGSRDLVDPSPIDFMLNSLREGYGESLHVICGGARGADSIAYGWAVEHGVSYRVFMADWETHGKAAGPIRNKRMLEEGQPNLVLAFTNDLSKSAGTRNMVALARDAGVPAWVLGSH